MRSTRSPAEKKTQLWKENEAKPRDEWKHQQTHTHHTPDPRGYTLTLAVRRVTGMGRTCGAPPLSESLLNFTKLYSYESLLNFLTQKNAKADIDSTPDAIGWIQKAHGGTHTARKGEDVSILTGTSP